MSKYGKNVFDNIVNFINKQKKTATPDSEKLGSLGAALAETKSCVWCVRRNR
jgi:hypothetical protein